MLKDKKMINSTLAYVVKVCDVCEEPIILKSVAGLPPACPFCGAPATEPIDATTALRLLEKKRAAEMATEERLRRSSDPFGRGGRQRMFVNGVEVSIDELRARGFGI
jgi:hypothetical protein